MQKMWIWFLGWEDPLEEKMTAHSSLLAWKIPRTEESGGLQSTGSQPTVWDLSSSTRNWTCVPCTGGQIPNQWPGGMSCNVVVIQLLSHVHLFLTTWTAAHQNSLSFTISWSLLKFLSDESVVLDNYLILCLPFLLLPSIFPGIRVFPNESALHIRWPKLQLQHQSFQWIFRVDFL